MICPFCSADFLRVLDKRDGSDGKTTRRRRECLKCKRRFTTFERVETLDLLVVKKDKQREKYYLAVQTFLSPGFAERVGEYRDFYRFRKMLVVNPKTGQAVVAVIGDAGPAAWTGKHLGGSPEVMDYLGREDGAKKGPVLYFFIDDAKDTIPLGPVKEL